MAVSREELYEAVWSSPMINVAKEYEVSGTYLAQVCAGLKVPRPTRGYWAKLKAGKALPRPPLPPPEPGDEVEWRRDGNAVTRAPLPSPVAPTEAPPVRRRASLPARHPLVDGVRPMFEATRKGGLSSDDLYLRPLKRKLPDILVSKDLLPTALDIASDLYLALEARGHRVVVNGFGYQYRRPELEHHLRSRRAGYHSQPWAPCDPTITFVGTVAVGLTIYEPAEEVEAKHVDGAWVRVTELPAPPPRRGRPPAPHPWTSRVDLPCRRLAVRAYSPYPGAEWNQVWLEGKPGQLAGMIPAICGELFRAAPSIARLAEEAERARKAQADRWAQEKLRREREEAEQRRAANIKASSDQLLSIIEAWRRAVGIEQFFEEASRRAETLGPGEREAIEDRIAKARQFVGSINPLQYLAAWRAPT